LRRAGTRLLALPTLTVESEVLGRENTLSEVRVELTDITLQGTAIGRAASQIVFAALGIFCRQVFVEAEQEHRGYGLGPVLVVQTSAAACVESSACPCARTASDSTSPTSSSSSSSGTSCASNSGESAGSRNRPSRPRYPRRILRHTVPRPASHRPGGESGLRLPPWPRLTLHPDRSLPDHAPGRAAGHDPGEGTGQAPGGHPLLASQ